MNILVRNGKVFTVDKDAVAIDAATGGILWRFVPDSASGSENAVDDRAFYVGTRGHAVYAIDVATGLQLWKSDVGPDWTFPGFVDGISVSGDTVYVGVIRYLNESGGLRAGFIAALDRYTGDTLWTYQGAGTDDDVNGAPSISGRILVANDLAGGAFFAVDRFTGQEIWRVVGPLDRFGPSAQSVIIGDSVYVGSNDEFVYKVNRNTGAQFWKTFVGGALHGLTVCGDHAFASSFRLVKLDRHTGRALAETLSGDEYLTSGLATDGQRVYASGPWAVYAFRC